MRRRTCLAALLTLGASIAAAPALAVVDVATESELRDAIFAANAGGDTAINLTADITLTRSLPMISADLTITGNGHTIDANDAGRVFFVESGTVHVADVRIENARAQGGNGGAAESNGGTGGGGGLGAGAAVFVNQGAHVTLTRVTVGDAAAAGGAGGEGAFTGQAGDGGGGGGGLGGDGGNGTGVGGGGGGYEGAGGRGGGSWGGGGGGGEFGAGGRGGVSLGPAGGGGGGATIDGGDAGYVPPSQGIPGAGGGLEGGDGGGPWSAGEDGAPRGGGGGGTAAPGGAGGIGGGGGGTGGDPSAIGGAGGDFGGGGGTGMGGLAGGAGGFGGGGGGAGSDDPDGDPIGGAGGFGGGGGGGERAGAGGAFGGRGGEGYAADGGGGAALGGAVFVRDGGSLTIVDGGFDGTYTVTGGTTGGTGGAMPGQAQGTTFFLHGAGTTGFEVSAGRTQTIAGADAIAGTGGLTKSGAGTLVIPDANPNYVGTTTVTGGTLAVGSDAALGSGAVTLDAGALRTDAALALGNAVTLGAGGGAVDTNGHDATLAGTITGAGGLTKHGAGVLTVTGANTYTGGTTVTEGTLAIGTGAALGSGSVTLDGAALRTDAALVLGNALTLGAGGGTVDTNGHDATLAGTIAGAGGLTKRGAGALTLTGANTYSGTTTIEAGTLIVDGSLASPVMVSSGTTLAGTGTLGAGVANHGTLAPGRSIGTLRITGPLDFGANAVYQVEVDAAGQADRIDVTGSATLGGTVHVIPQAGAYGYLTEATILTATDPLVGTFDAVTSASAFLDPTLLYSTNTVALRLTRNDLSFASVAATDNQRAVADALDAGGAGASGDLATLLNGISTLSATQARDAYDELAGASLAAFATPQLLDRARFDALVQANAMRRGEAAVRPRTGLVERAQDDDAQVGPRGTSGVRLAQLGASLAELGPALSFAPAAERTGPGAWISGYGFGGEVDGDGNAAPFDHRFGGVVGGVDHRFSADTIVGVAVGYSHGELDHEDGADTGEIDTVRASLYAVHRPEALAGRLVLDGALGFGVSDYETERRIAFAGLDRTAKADGEGHELAARLGASHRWDWAGYEIAPRADLAYVHLERDGFDEHGAGAADLRVDDRDIDSLQTRLGVALGRRFVSDRGTAWTPAASLGWRHEFGDTDRHITASFAGVPGRTFRVEGAEAARDALEIGLGLSVVTPAGTSWFVSYTADLADDETAHGFQAGLRKDW
jgi:outer membrane autotransporter protein